MKRFILSFTSNVGHPSSLFKKNKNVNVTNTQTTTHYLIVDE